MENAMKGSVYGAILTSPVVNANAAFGSGVFLFVSLPVLTLCATHRSIVFVIH